ncbi:hypothetical protein HanIR_Chr15g0744091 [Helianthus annuus]|nr:hypothetical protein HanIR_Chr15g0744091 [Helianthus annuus]
MKKKTSYDAARRRKHSIRSISLRNRGGFSMVAGVARATPQLYLRSVIFFSVSCFCVWDTPK